MPDPFWGWIALGIVSFLAMCLGLGAEIYRRLALERTAREEALASYAEERRVYGKYSKAQAIREKALARAKAWRRKRFTLADYPNKPTEIRKRRRRDH